ncbi:MAG TPA: EAL domain-containing protein [Solirubrobacteraceae bacterium]|nr:EAL domain-containing protein [Solirubrobacteraceae bacterium]
MAEVDHVAGEAEARWRSLVEQIPAVVYTCDFDQGSTLRYLSPRMEELVGYPVEMFLADPELWYDLIHPDDIERIREAEQRSYSLESRFDEEYRMIHRDGSVVHVWERDALVRDADGRPLIAQGVLIDVTELRRTEAALREARDRAQQYLDTAGAVTVAIDLHGRVSMLNRSGHELLGHEDGALVGVDWFATCVAPDQRDELRHQFETSMRTSPPDASSPPHHSESRLVCRDGTIRTIIWSGTKIVEGGRVVGALASGIDVTERRRAEEQVAYLAYHDALTGLPNRMLLQEHLELALARARRARQSVALLFLDLDDFKLVNDGLGHAAGDELLSQVAGRLARHVRDSDTLARQGGDEFLLLIPDIERDAEERAVSTANRIVEAVREPFRIGGTEFEIGASVGVSLFPHDAKDADALLEHADAAMYDAKADPSTGVCVYRAERQSFHGVERLSFSRRLRQAIEGGELALHWQPIFTLGKGRLLGVEALVRWQDPRDGLRAAGDFLPVAERAGMLDLLDDWVIAAVSAQRREWRARGFSPHVGLNLSPRQLRSDRLGPVVEGLRAGGPLSDVTIELTESVAAHEDAAIRGVIEAMRNAGLDIALDDFGVAYSSLSRLAELSTRWVKVDRAFMHGVPESAPAVALLESVVGLLDALGMSVVVEGVEREEQLEHLRAIGVEAVQGYHLSPPMPASELDPLLCAQPHWRLPSPPGAV